MMKEIVIKIPDKMYSNFIKNKAYYEAVHEQSSIDPSIELTLAVINGKVLPKGHGALKDVNSIPEEDKDIMVKSLLAPNSIAFIGAITIEDYINSLSTVIEADNEENV